MNKDLKQKDLEASFLKLPNDQSPFRPAVLPRFGGDKKHTNRASRAFWRPFQNSAPRNAWAFFLAEKGSTIQEYCIK